jgi:hypothetical protein
MAAGVRSTEIKVINLTLNILLTTAATARASKIMENKVRRRSYYVVVVGRGEQVWFKVYGSSATGPLISLPFLQDKLFLVPIPCHISRGKKFKIKINENIHVS